MNEFGTVKNNSFHCQILPIDPVDTLRHSIKLISCPNYENRAEILGDSLKSGCSAEITYLYNFC